MKEFTISLTGTVFLIFLVIPAASLNAGPLFGTATSYEVGGIEPRSIFAADLDGDGDLDLVTANSYSYVNNAVSVLMNNGDGSFAAPLNYSSAGYPSSACAVDLDGDGDKDLAVSNGTGSKVSILKNKGDGTFEAKIDYGTGVNPRCVIAADLDGDGDLDLVTANKGSDEGGGPSDSTVSVLKNNGDGTFGPQVKYGAGPDPVWVTAADLDADGDKDLAVSESRYGGIMVLRNNGDGTFAPRVIQYTPSYTLSVVAADLDLDGDQDLVDVNSSGGGTGVIYVLRNNGDGSFLPFVEYPAKLGAVSVIVADLDLDGDPDVVTANGGSYQGENTISVLLNSGDGSFAPKIDYPSDGVSPKSVFVADFDSDGDLDLAVANSASNTVSIFKNLSNPVCTAKAGDVNGDSKYSLADVVGEVNLVFKNAPPPAPACRADANADGESNLTDVILLINKIFKNGPNPIKIGECCL